MDDTVKLLLPLLLGGVSGATVSFLYNRLFEKEKRALEAAKDYFALREKIGNAKGYLASPTAFETHPHEAMAVIREVGDRLNLIAYFYIKNLLKRNFLDESGLIVDLREFLYLIDTAQHVDTMQKHFAEVGTWWPNLFDLRAFHLKEEKEK